MAIFVHLASVWVPFTSEAKEAVAHYPELLREITLALQECGRKLWQHLRARAKAESETKRKSLFERYIPELGHSLGKITGQDRASIESIFHRALPNFVNIAAEPETPKPGGDPNGAPPAASSEPESEAKPAPTAGGKKGEGKKGTDKTKKAPKPASKKGEQLRLLE